MGRLANHSLDRREAARLGVVLALVFSNVVFGIEPARGLNITFIVNSTGDASDVLHGDAVCDTGGLNSEGAPECTLRAAIEEANDLPPAYEEAAINFNIPPSDPGYTASPLSYTIAVGSPFEDIVKEGAVALANLPPAFDGEVLRLTPVQSINLLVSAFYQTIRAFQLPFAFLGVSLLVLVGLGSATKVPLLLAGRLRMHWSVVLLDRESSLRVHQKADTDTPVLYNFNPTTESILRTGSAKRVESTDWMKVHTPSGEGFVDAFHLTEQVDLKTFARDDRPAKLVREFAETLRTGGDVARLISHRGILLALTGTPAMLAPRQLEDLLGDSRLRRLRTIDGVLQAQEDFRLAVAEPFLHAYDATEEITANTAHSKAALIPAELWNFRYLAFGEGTSQPWLVFFEYEGGRPRIVGLGIDE